MAVGGEHSAGKGSRSRLSDSDLKKYKANQTLWDNLERSRVKRDGMRVGQDIDIKYKFKVGDIVMVLGIFEYEILSFDGQHYLCKRADNGEQHYYGEDELRLKEQGE